jgi:hypothetical protein
MARAGGTTKVSTYLNERYRFLINGIALGMPTKYLQDKAIQELGERINDVSLTQLRNPAFRKKYSKKFHKEIERVERDFIRCVGDRKMLFPLFRAIWAFTWAEERAAKEDHQNAIRYLEAGHKMMESVPGHRILAEACLSDTGRALQDAQGDTGRTDTEEVTFEVVMKRVRQVRTQGMKDIKRLLGNSAEATENKEVE